MEADNHDARLKDYSEKIIDKIHRAKTDISEEFTTS